MTAQSKADLMRRLREQRKAAGLVQAPRRESMKVKTYRYPTMSLRTVAAIDGSGSLLVDGFGSKHKVRVTNVGRLGTEVEIVNEHGQYLSIMISPEVGDGEITGVEVNAA